MGRTLLFMALVAAEFLAWEVPAALGFAPWPTVSEAVRAGCRHFWPLRLVGLAACAWLGWHLFLETDE